MGLMIILFLLILFLFVLPAFANTNPYINDVCHGKYTSFLDSAYNPDQSLEDMGLAFKFYNPTCVEWYDNYWAYEMQIIIAAEALLATQAEFEAEFYAASQTKKVLVNDGVLYPFQGDVALNLDPVPQPADLISFAPTGITAELYALAAASTVHDFLRLSTLRMWYGYGWTLPGEITPQAGSVSHKPMFGYFPAAIRDTGAASYIYSSALIQNSLESFYVNFDFATTAPYFYGDAPKPVPKVYISEITPGWPYVPAQEEYQEMFGLWITTQKEFPETSQALGGPPGAYSIDGTTDGLVDLTPDAAGLADWMQPSAPANTCKLAVLGDGTFDTGDVILRNWFYNRITIKKFPHYSAMTGVDFDFAAFLNDDFVPNLNQKDIIEVPEESFLESVEKTSENPLVTPLDLSEFKPKEIPKRYYDMPFQITVADGFFAATPKYNVYEKQYENIIQDSRFKPIFEPILPNIYMISFASLGIQDYFNLISLNDNNKICDPADLTYLSFLLQNFTWSPSQSPYMGAWLTGLDDYLNVDKPRTLADEYRKLIFSNLFKDKYIVSRFQYMTTAPMAVDISIPYMESATKEGLLITDHLWAAMEELSLTVEHLGNLDTALPWDAEVNLISDTQQSIPKQEKFWSLKHDLGSPGYYPAETPMMMDELEDITFEVSNTWNIQDWFNLYCVPPEITPDCEDRVFVSASAMTTEGITGALTTPEEMEYILTPQFDSWEPGFVGPAGNLSDNIHKPVAIGGEDYFGLGIFPLTTPNSEQWQNCDETSDIVAGAFYSLYQQYGAIIDNHFRTYEQMINGELAHSSPVFYRVEKRNPEKDTVIQNTFFPSSMLAHEHLDTQVRYNQPYEYNLYGYYFVVGNEYWYNNLDNLETYTSYTEGIITCPPGYVMNEEGTMCVVASEQELTFIEGNWITLLPPVGQLETLYNNDMYDFSSVVDVSGISGYNPQYLQWQEIPDINYTGDAVLFADPDAEVEVVIAAADGVSYEIFDGTFCDGATIRTRHYEDIDSQLREHGRMTQYRGNDMMGPKGSEYSSSTYNELELYGIYAWLSWADDNPGMLLPGATAPSALPSMKIPIGPLYWLAAGRPMWAGHPMIIWKDGFAKRDSTNKKWTFYHWGHPDASTFFAGTVEATGEPTFTWDPLPEWGAPASFTGTNKEVYEAWRHYISIENEWLLPDGSDGLLAAETLAGEPSKYLFSSKWMTTGLLDWAGATSGPGPTERVLYPIYGGVNLGGCCEAIGDDTGHNVCPDPTYLALPSELEPITSTTLQLGEEIWIGVQTKPYPVLVETKAITPAGVLTTKILDVPPLPPDVDIIPYRSVKDKTLITCNGNVGAYQDYPIIIEQDDKQQFADMIVARDITEELEVEEIINNVEDYLVEFGSDDYPKAFEIFRIDSPPTNYQDFAFGRKLVLDNTKNNEIVVTSNSINDSILPNKKYWYTFRTIDAHDHISNPTGVFQVEMVDTGNSIFPIIEIYSFPEIPPSYAKPMKRYLKISPSSIQEAKNPDITSAQNFVDDPNLAHNVDETMWGKQYKLRITSKSTGKKVDINFSFKQGVVDDTDL